jgi:hypothetical protein
MNFGLQRFWGRAGTTVGMLLLIAADFQKKEPICLFHSGSGASSSNSQNHENKTA